MSAVASAGTGSPWDDRTARGYFGMTSFWPTLISSPVKLLAFLSSATVMPWVLAMDVSVSPF